ncbi:MAG: hypothetical protein WC254_01105 [Candidatus Woesearchaeota archaeon]|jgi:hypothetical protein
MEYKVIIGIIAVSVGVISYIPYTKSTIKGITKPHAFSWLIWSVIAAITFAAQLSGGAGPGAWISAVATISCFIIFLMALKKGEKNIVLLDWLSLGGAAISLFCWYLTNSPLMTVIIITIIDCFGFIPTIRKSYFAPAEENTSLYALSSLSYLATLFAMNTYSIITILNPFVMVIANSSFAFLLLWRRKILKT